MGPLLAWLHSQFPATLVVKWEIRHSPSHHTKGCFQKNCRGLPRHCRFSGMGLQSDCELESHSETENLDPLCISTSVIRVFSVLYTPRTSGRCRMKWKVEVNDKDHSGCISCTDIHLAFILINFFRLMTNCQLTRCKGPVPLQDSPPPSSQISDSKPPLQIST